jgi:hypothetical protein
MVSQFGPGLQADPGTFSSDLTPWCTVSGHFARMKADTERRSGTRIATSVATRVRSVQGTDQTAQTAQTRDVSANGVPELTSGEKCWVCCQATIVRVEEEGSEFGVAAQIRRMDILPEVTA